MLTALAPEESEFSSREENVATNEAFSMTLFREIEMHYGFVGGSLDQYVEYFLRTDMDTSMWTWFLSHEVKAVAGFSVVPKKNPELQRKLIMMCATNYAWCSGKTRENHGMLGGVSLSSLHVPGDQWEVSCFDETNAFTSIVTPAWMWAWTACPPVPASMVRAVLPEHRKGI